MEQVAGFSTFCANELPWSATLPPTLKGLTLLRGYVFNEIGVKDMKCLESFMKGALHKRVPLLFENAGKLLEASVSAFAAQDPRLAQQTRARLVARMGALKANLDLCIARGSYDQPLESRIFCLTDNGTDNLISPIRLAKVRGGTADLMPTSLIQRYRNSEAELEELEELAELAGGGLGESMQGVEENEQDGEFDELLDEAFGAEPRKARERKQAVPFEAAPDAARPKKRPASASVEARPPKKIPSDGNISRIASFNPRTKQPYVRDSYNIKAAGHAIAAGVNASVAAAVELSEARNKLKLQEVEHHNALATLQGQLDVANASLQDADVKLFKAVAAAKLKERSRSAIREKAATYDGMNAAVRLMKQKEIRTSSSAAGSGSGSIRKPPSPVSPVSSGGSF